MAIRSDTDALTHDHVFLGASHDENARRTLCVVLLTSAMMVGEITAGALFNSMALLADGFHMATHAGALGLAAAAYAYARKHAHSSRYSFGTGKVGDLAGFASALVLGLVAVGIAVTSVERLLEPRPVAFGEAALIAAVGLFVNLASVALLRGGHHFALAHDHDHEHHHAAHHHAHHDNNLRSAYRHVLADALISLLVIAALLGGRYLGWIWLDSVMGIAGAIVIASWSWTLMRDTAGVLLDASDLALEHEVREQVEGPGDVRINDLHVWRLGPGGHAAILSVTGRDRETVRQRLSPIHEIAHLTIEAR